MSFEQTGADLIRQVTARARDCCEYCLSQRRFSPSPFSVEHIVPRSRGGSTEPHNLALSCQGCNNHKYAHLTGVDPVSAQEVVLYNRRTDVWSEHFAWSNDLTVIVGLTARGRATVLRLNLNRPEVAALRRILVGARLHPPDYPYTVASP